MLEENSPRSMGKYVDLMAPCYYCIHLTQIGHQSYSMGWTCKAFPHRIPGSIWKRHAPHLKPVPYQVGTHVYRSNAYNHGEGYEEEMTFEGAWKKV